MLAQSAGILLYRVKNNAPEYFLVHPGGPFWKKKDAGAWSIPKGEFDETESPQKAAIRELMEETGHRIEGTLLPLTPVKQKAGKLIHAWAAEGDLDASAIVSENFTIEWPPRSGKLASFPEVDRAGWFFYEDALVKINPAQARLVEELNEYLTSPG